VKNNHRIQNNTGIWLVTLVFIVVSSLFVSGCGAEKPQVYRVGVLSGLDFFADTTAGFKAGMTELGYVEGENIVYDVQQANVDPVAYEQILKQFVADKVDLIFVFPTEAAAIAKVATQDTNIPVVFAHAILEGNDLVESVRQPGENITGVRFPGADLSVKRLELLHKLVPQAKRVWVAYLPVYPSVPGTLEALRQAASSIGITLVEAPVSSVADIQVDLQARSAAADMGLDAILLIVEPIAVSSDGFALISEFAAEHKVPICGALVSESEQSAVFSYIPDNGEVGELAAPLADKIFKGTSAGTIPVVSPENHLQVNYKVALELGLNVDEGLLSQADEIIR
jgi:putative ABC transport system substrate-binding protein